MDKEVLSSIIHSPTLIASEDASMTNWRWVTSVSHQCLPKVRLLQLQNLYLPLSLLHPQNLPFASTYAELANSVPNFLFADSASSPPSVLSTPLLRQLFWLRQTLLLSTGEEVLVWRFPFLQNFLIVIFRCSSLVVVVGGG